MVNNRDNLFLLMCGLLLSAGPLAGIYSSTDGQTNLEYYFPILYKKVRQDLYRDHYSDYEIVDALILWRKEATLVEAKLASYAQLARNNSLSVEAFQDLEIWVKDFDQRAAGEIERFNYYIPGMTNDTLRKIAREHYRTISKRIADMNQIFSEIQEIVYSSRQLD